MVSTCTAPYLVGPAALCHPRRIYGSSSIWRTPSLAVPAIRSQASEDTSSFTRKLPGVALGLLAAVSLNLSPASGPALAQQSVATEGLDTETKPAGQAGATALVEGSDITGESVESILNKLKNKVLPESKAMIAKASDDGSTYTASLAKEIETVEKEVESQIQRINESEVDASNLKSFLSGVEQQLNALKANGGFD